ncbi:hypothetical protein EON65_14800 [archaeon]|nr:MAG: hypothetical protein EON65_14800 [archaeon]
MEESMTTESWFVPIMEEEALRILKQPIDNLIADVAGSHIAVKSLRQYADGYRLQGGNDQLDKAMVMYNAIEDILRQLHSICSAEHWHRQETYMRKFGIGMVYAGVKLFKSAEQYVLHAMRMLIHTHTHIPISEPDKVKGKRQLLDMATCLIKNVYFAVPKLREYPGFNVPEQCTKAWHVCLSFILDDYVDMPAGHLDSCLQGLNMPSVTREAVLAIYDKKLSSRAGLARYCQLPDSVREKYRKGLDILYKALVRLGQHELAVQMYQQVINEVDKVYACIPIDTMALELFHPIRLVCVRRVLCYCDELITKATTSELAPSSAADPRVVGLLDFAFSHLTLLGDECVNGTGCERCELWGDLYRMQGYCAAALCLYAACFHSHEGNMNRHMKRLSHKINHLLDNREVRDN